MASAYFEGGVETAELKLFQFLTGSKYSFYLMNCIFIIINHILNRTKGMSVLESFTDV